MKISLRLKELQARIDHLKRQHNVNHAIKLLAASKSQPANKLLEAYHVGQRLFGENYLQEALDKIEQLKDKDIEWHFIGNIQSNKTKKIATHFSWVQSISSIKIAERLNAQRPVNAGPLNVCIEINLDHENNKSGIYLEELSQLASACSKLPMLKLRGLMAIPHKTSSKEEQRASFRKLKQLFDHLKHQGYELDTLSMGMSGDYDAAIAEGSTMIRIGTALLGDRH